jgi:predicted RNA polymerase sigma factor
MGRTTLPFVSVVFFPFPFCSTDEDTAEYLYDILSSANDDSPWLTQERRVIVGAIQGALQGLRGIGKVYEERVAEALATFQLPPPAM